MTNERKKYTPEFKVEAVKRITEQGYKTSKAARNYGLLAEKAVPGIDPSFRSGEAICLPRLSTSFKNLRHDPRYESKRGWLR